MKNISFFLVFFLSLKMVGMQDVCSRIVEHYKDAHAVLPPYTINAGNLFLPVTTLFNLDLPSDALDDNNKLKNGFLPLSARFFYSPSQVIFFNHAEKIEHIFPLKQSAGLPFTHVFDGLNNDNRAVLALHHSNVNDCELWHIYVLAPASPSKNNKQAFTRIQDDDHVFYQYKPKKPIAIIPNLKTLCLELDSNKIVYSFSKVKYKNKPWRLRIQNLDAKRFEPSRITQPFPFLFRKIIHLGNTKQGKEKKLGDIYMGLTTSGSLISFWLNKKNKFAYAKQKCAHTFKDIAVDSEKRFDDFKYMMALITVAGELFVTDWLLPGKPTLLYTITLPKDALKRQRFYYDDGKCTVINKNGTVYTASGLGHGLAHIFNLPQPLPS